MLNKATLYLFTLLLFTGILANTGEDNVATETVQETIDTPAFVEKFQVEILKRGSHNIYAKEGDEIMFHYEGKNMEGETYDSSFSRRQPYKFKLGSLGVIRCWNEAMKRMTLGDRIKVVCPSKYAYGKHGLGKILPGGSSAVLEFELLGINDEKLSEDYIDDL